MSRLRIAVLASGRGSNMESIQRAIKEGRLNAEIVAAASDNPEARALVTAKEWGVPTELAAKKGRFADEAERAEHDRALIAAIEKYNPDVVALAGYMRVVSGEFVRHFEGRVINIHPALLPAFPGLHVQRKALEYGVKIAGCTVHFVDEKVDHGPIILQAAVPVREDDTEESLSARILTEEHRIYPEALRLIAEGRVRVEGRRVVITE